MKKDAVARAEPKRSELERAHGKRGTLLHLLHTIFRFIARHVTGFWGAIAAYLTVGFFVGLACTAIFAAFASAVHAGLTQSFDVAILKSLASIRTPLLDEIMLELTALGGGSVLIMIVIIASLFLWVTDHKWSVYLLVISLVGGQILNQVLKLLFQRPRPSVVVWGQQVTTLSFPSGHAMTSIIAYGAVAYLVGRLGKTPQLRRMVWGVAAVLVCAIGFSRMYLGVHYPTDVLAGFLGGAAWLAFVASGLAAVEYFSERRPATKHEEHDLHAEKERASGVRS
jgi:undecaprenyl-diphosphatase